MRVLYHVCPFFETRRRAAPQVRSFTEAAQKGSVEFNVSASMLDMFRQVRDFKAQPGTVLLDSALKLARRIEATALRDDARHVLMLDTF